MSYIFLAIDFHHSSKGQMDSIAAAREEAMPVWWEACWPLAGVLHAFQAGGRDTLTREISGLMSAHLQQDANVVLNPNCSISLTLGCAAVLWYISRLLAVLRLCCS